MGKNVAVFVDVANIFYAAKAAGVDIDYVTLLKAGSAGRDLVRAYAYTGLDPENENQRNFHDFLRRHGYRVVSKDIRKYGDGKVKANLDIELVVDMMKTARNLDVAIVVSGDGDFAPAIRAVQEMGVRVEVVSFRGNTSSDLMDVADQFTDITQIAKVEKGSSRSGRRVAGDEADLSMTEVPEKQSEGTGERSRGRGRSRRAAEPAASRSGRGRSRAAAATDEPTLVVLPGEKLSRAAGAPDAAGSEGDAGAELEPAALAGADEAEVDGAEGTMDDGGRRRRRRRGGRGRGRGRGREDGYPEAIESAGVDGEDDAGADDGELDLPPARPRPASTFGSVWDSQIGIPAAGRTAPGAIPPDEEDLDEPEIPEYLLTERRRRQGGRGRGGRGSAYAAALERERYGGGRGGGISRYVEPPRGRESGGVRREPAPPRGGRPAPRGTGDEPWSEVPPEIEAMLRAQLGPVPARTPRAAAVAPSPADEAAADGAPSAEVEKPSRRATSGRKRTIAKAASDSAADADEVEVPATKTTTRRRSTRTTKAATKSADEAEATAASTDKPKRTTRSRKPAAAKDAAASPETADAADEPKTPRRRTTRKKADPAT